MHGLTWSRVAIYALATLPLATLGGFMLPAQAHQQDASQPSGGDAVADAARKAREQKKKDAVKPKKVYTDDDVNHLTSGTTTATAETTGAPEASAEGEAKTGEAQAKEAGKTGEPEESPEVKWRKRFREVYANLARAEKEVDILQREGNKAQTQYYSDPQKALQEQYSRKDINEKDTKIAAKKKEIEQLKQQINDMQDELRKSGGDPGWGKE
jgi:chromosome segregation ATPase